MRGGPLYSLHRSYLNSFVIERTAVARSRSLGGCTQVSEEPHSSLLLSKISVIPSICMLHGENSGNATTELTLIKRDITGDRVLNILIISPERIMPVRCTSLTSDGSFPPSPTDDTTSKRLSWGKLVQKLTEFSGASFNHSVDSDSDSCSRSDCSDSGSDFLSDVSTSDSDMFYDPMEETLCEEVVELISSSLSDAKDGPLKCSKLLIPHQLLEHIGQELRHLAASEPCGLRGALIDLCVEQEDICRSVEQIAVDPYLVPTFQLTLVLRLESEGLWPKIQGLFAARAHSTPTVKHALKLSTGFRVIKKKLYSSEELLIEEC